MAEIINQSQQLTLGALSPQSYYSRIVSCVVSLKAAAAKVYAITPVVGQNVRLLKVTCFFTPMPADATKKHLFRIYSGTTKISSADEIRTWTNVLPLQAPGYTDEPWVYSDGRTEMSWSMNRLFTGATRRFGIWAEVGPFPPREIRVSFEISEG